MAKWVAGRLPKRGRAVWGQTLRDQTLQGAPNAARRNCGSKYLDRGALQHCNATIQFSPIACPRALIRRSAIACFDPPQSTKARGTVHQMQRAEVVVPRTQTEARYNTARRPFSLSTKSSPRALVVKWGHGPATRSPINVLLAIFIIIIIISNMVFVLCYQCFFGLHATDAGEPTPLRQVP